MTSVATRIDLLTGKPAGLPGTAPAPSTCSTDLSANPGTSHPPSPPATAPGPPRTTWCPPAPPPSP